MTLIFSLSPTIEKTCVVNLATNYICRICSVFGSASGLNELLGSGDAPR